MWNDWLSSLTGPSGDQSGSHNDMPEPIETPRRFTNPAQIERLQNLQSQHQQLQVQQLHLLHKQFKLQRDAMDSGESTCTEGSSSAPTSPTSGVSTVLAEAVKTAAGSNANSSSSGSYGNGEIKKEDGSDHRYVLPATISLSIASHQASMKAETDDTRASFSEAGLSEEASNLPCEVWQQFHALQAQQWAQALNQARIAKRQTNGAVSNGGSTPLNGANALGLIPSSSGGGGMSGGKRCKAYAAPKGVWKNNGGYNATIYVHKRRIYGPIRRDLSDAIEDRKEMEEALRELTAIHNSPEDAAILEVEMREVVAGLRNRSTPNRAGEPNSSGSTISTPPQSGSGLVTPSRLMNPNLPMGGQSTEGPRKRLRLVASSAGGPQGAHQDAQALILGEMGGDHAPVQSSPDVLGPFAAPMQIKPEDEHLDMYDNGGFFTEEHDDMIHLPRGVGYTPNAGPIRDVYGSPGALMGFAGGMMDDAAAHLDMLPDPMGGGGMGLWGSH